MGRADDDGEFSVAAHLKGRVSPQVDATIRVPFLIGQTLKKIPAAFYRTSAGAEPVRDWLKGLLPEERREIGQNIATVAWSCCTAS